MTVAGLRLSRIATASGAARPDAREMWKGVDGAAPIISVTTA